MLYERMLAEGQWIQDQIHSVTKQLSTLPEGNLYCSRNGNQFKWFISDTPKPQYLSKTKRNLAEQFAARKYLTLRLEDLTNEKRAIDFYTRHHHADYGKAELLLTKPGYQELLAPYFQPLSQKLSAWMNAPYEKCTEHPEHLIHRASSGNLVRSKSEVLIDMALYTNKIPFRYECPLQLGASTIYPDFTICHPDTGQLFYWEHFGLMDDPEYCRETFFKLRSYSLHKIYPMINLITTYETKENPLSVEIINQIVNYYFL